MKSNSTSLLLGLFSLLTFGVYAQSAEQMAEAISTETDPEFIYEYQGSKFVPPAGKTLLIMGQTKEGITDYQNKFGNEEPPAGWSAYWGIPEFKGVASAFKNNTGSTQNHQMFVDEFPNTVIQSAMWMVGTWDVAKKTGFGSYDKVIKQYARWAKKVKRPIYLRIGYEFDGPHNELEPRDYIRAYKRIVDLFRAEKADNIAFVWHSYAAKPYKGYNIVDWYPGDDYVDWVGVSIFGHAYGGDDFGSECDAVLAFAKEHAKPVMIAESNPIHGISKDDPKVWEEWFVPYFNFIHKKNIKAVSFINEDWTSLSIAGIEHWKDARLSNNELVAKAWFEATAQKRFLHASKKLYKQLGYKKK